MISEDSKNKPYDERLWSCPIVCSNGRLRRVSSDGYLAVCTAASSAMTTPRQRRLRPAVRVARIRLPGLAHEI